QRPGPVRHELFELHPKRGRVHPHRYRAWIPGSYQAVSPLDRGAAVAASVVHRPGKVGEESSMRVRRRRRRILGAALALAYIAVAPGNTAKPYAGKDRRTGKEVVVKIFSHADDGRGRERFLREARLHEELTHEAILELIGHGSDAGVDYMVTRRLRPGALWDV